MEAVPRMPMLSFELKQCPEYVDFGPALKQYIRDHYGEDPAHYNKACSDLEQLRQSAVHVSHDFMGCSTLKKYYAQLQFLQGRFPMGEEGECGINFTWEDVFLGREVTIPDVKFEQACILYNIGALHSILGSIETRQSADGMKVACTHFQCAAWAFEFLRDHFGSSNLSVDMSHEVLTFQVNLMLSQAQECILEKSMIDSRKNTITAKVSAQVVEFYRNVIRSLQTENMDAILGSRKYKDWKKRTDLKILFYEVITNYYMGRNSEEHEKFGECVTYFTLSFDKLKDCVKMAKSESSDIQESLRFTNDVVGGKYQSAKKDNDFVYHDKIPAVDTLPEVKGASLVKGIPFNWNDHEVSGPDIFQKLVPMSAHEASSMYSEEKAKLMRQVGTEIEEKNVALLKFMSSLNLDPSKLNFEPERLPQDLLEKCAAVSVRQNAIKDLVEAMGAVSNSATEVQMAIEEINGLIENDYKEEEEFQNQFGKRSANPMLPEMKKDCDRFEEGHKKGNQSNVDLHKAMNTHITNLKLLAGPLEDIKNNLPSLERDRDPESDAIIKELQRMMDKVEEMKNQRAMLEDQFRNQIKNDDITNQIVAQDGGSNTMVMFDEQLKKHDQLIGVIRQNLDAQDKILKVLTDVNAKYANTRKATAETIARREAAIDGLKNSFDVYEDLLAKSQKGLDFYKKLESNVNRLLERCRGICKQQAEERQQIIDRRKPKEPPPRPVATKPADSLPQIPVQNTLPSTQPTDPSIGSLPMSSTGTLGPMPDFHSAPPGFEGPKLKDYLPFMKPKTFGKGRVNTGSLPSSLISSPVHLPPSPDSVPASPQHGMGMSDDEMRKLGITDPKVLAMIRAHSLPPSGNQQQPPGERFNQAAEYASQQPTMGRVSQAINYPSPSESPNMPGAMSNSVRIDRGTKPAMYSSNLGPQGPLPSQPRMPHPSGLQYQPGYNVNQAGGYQQPHSGMNQSMPQVQGGMNSNVTYPSPVQSPPLPSQSQSGIIKPGMSQPQSGMNSDTVYSMPNQPTQIHQSYPSPAPSSQFQPLPNQPVPSQSGFQPAPNQTLASQPGFQPAQNQPLASQPVIQPGPSQPTPSQSGFQPIPSQPLPSQPGFQPTPSQTLPSQPGFQPVPSQLGFQPTPNQPIPSQPGFQPTPNQPLASQPGFQPVPSQSGFQPAQSQTGSYSGQQCNAQPGIISSMGQSAIPTGQNVPQTNTVSAISQMGQQTGGQFSQVAPPTGHPALVGILPPDYGDALKNRTNQTELSRGTGQNLTTQTSASTSYNQPASHMPATQIQSHGQDVQQPQQNFASQQTQPTSTLQGNIRSVQSGQGQMYQPQSIQGQQMVGQNQAQVSQPVQMQPGIPVQGNQPSWTSQGQIVSSGQVPFPQPQPSRKTPATQTYEQQQPKPSIPSTYSQAGQQGQSLQQPKGQGQIDQGQPGVPAQNQGYRFQQPNVSQQNQPSGQQNYQYQQQGQIQNQGQIQQNQGQPQPQMKGQNTQLTSQGQGQFPNQLSSMQQPQNQILSTQQPQNAGQQYSQVSTGQQYSQHSTGQAYSQPQQLGQQTYPQPQQQLSQTTSQVQPNHPQQQTTVMGQNLGPSSQPSQHNTFSSQQTAHMGQGLNVHGQGQNVPLSWQNQPSQIQSSQQSQNSSQDQSYSMSGGQQGHQLPRQQVSTQQQQYPAPHSTSLPGTSQQIIRPNVPPQSSQQFPNSQQIVGPQVPQMGYNQQPQGQQITQIPQGGQYQSQQQQQPSQQRMVNPMMSQVPVNPMTQQQPVNTMTTQQQFMSGHQQMQMPAGVQSQINLPTSLPQTVAPQGSYSSSLQQLNPLSPPDILPQPILPSPLKPMSDIQLPVQEVSTEVSISKHDVHPRSRESPIIHRKQPEKTHSRSGSNTSQPEFRLQRQHSSSSIGSSLDDILSSSPLDSTIKADDSVLTPKVLTAQEIAQQKEEALLKGTLGRQFSKDPYPDATKMDKFIAETEKLAKLVESLSKATCSGPSHLDIAWKEIIEDHDIHGKKHSMAIGRCYPMKNRNQDVLPYDETRVLLASHKDDYINGSWINDLAESCPKFIATQAPLHSTLFDFWLMVYEQGSEVIVMLSSEIESQDTKKYPEYWPPEKGKSAHHGPITLTLQSVKEEQLWTERIIHLQHQHTKQGRTIVQLQYKNWPVSGFPEKALSILQFINEVHTFYRQQRSLLKPVMVHCSNGIGRTGTFLMIYTGMQEIDHGNGIVNIQTVAKKMLQQRRYVIREKSQLKFCYEAILYHAQDILAKQGILVHKASFGDKLPQPREKSYHWTPTDDVVFGACSLNDLKSSVEKLGLNLGMSEQHGPKKMGIPKHEVSNEEVDKTQRPSSPLNGKEDIKEVTPYSSLPDVVQRTDMSVQDKESDQKLNKMSAGVSSLSGSNASLLSIGSETDNITGSPIHKIKSRDSSPKPSSLHGSHEGSPKLQSLLDLQNPNTFTLGMDGGKKKITKASFMDKTSSLSDNMDTSDPLGSLDPLWTMKK